MRTTAAVTEERGAPFTIQDVDVDDPRSGEVRVELVACGVCHTDAIARDGDLPFPFPGVLGHEGVGRVEAVGDGVTSVAVGDPVLLGWPWCGRCRNCVAGHPGSACSWDRSWGVVAGRTAARRSRGPPENRCTATSSGSRPSPGTR